MLKTALIVSLLAIGCQINAEGNSYFTCSASINRPVLETTYGIDVGLGGYKLIGNILLLGGYGEYFYNNKKYLGNGMITFGIGHAFDRGLLLSLQGSAGLGGGAIDNSGGAIFTYGIGAAVSHHLQSNVYIGVFGRYNHINTIVGFNDNNESFEYLSIGVRVTFAK